jgi:hypothetical protein
MGAFVSQERHLRVLFIKFHAPHRPYWASAQKNHICTSKFIVGTENTCSGTLLRLLIRPTDPLWHQRRPKGRNCLLWSRKVVRHKCSLFFMSRWLSTPKALISVINTKTILRCLKTSSYSCFWLHVSLQCYGGTSQFSARTPPANHSFQKHDL